MTHTHDPRRDHEPDHVAGTQAYPHECLVLGVSTRLAQYCIGPGDPVSPALAGTFFGVLGLLVALCVAEAAEASALGPPPPCGLFWPPFHVIRCCPPPNCSSSFESQRRNSIRNPSGGKRYEVAEDLKLTHSRGGDLLVIYWQKP